MGPAGERSEGSGLPLVLLLVSLLLGAQPAQGNVGAAAGNCRCERHRNEPPLVRRFPDRLVAWERCQHLVRFTFPKNPVCGLDQAPWVLQLIAQGRGLPRSGPETQPSPTSRAPLLQPSSSVGATPVVPMETLPSRQVLSQTPPPQHPPCLTHTTAALESVRTIVLPRNGAVAEVSPTRFGQEGGVPGWPRTLVLSALGIVLLLVTVGLLCWCRRPRRGSQPALTAEQQVWMLQQRPAGGATCCPRADDASGSGWGN
ncbi:C-X-C motif chemokine 16 [Erythrolamprus reginae]|uniref:C-X-C motif chemokine 16 n=1 Tax=Erythrolamprus reginae TaxID=121349 RepID=UPI00396C7949